MARVPMRASRYAIGEASFVEETEQRLGELRTGRVQDKDLALPIVTVAFDTVDHCVAERYGRVKDTMKEPGSPRKVRLGAFYKPHVYCSQETPACCTLVSTSTSGN